MISGKLFLAGGIGSNRSTEIIDLYNPYNPCVSTLNGYDFNEPFGTGGLIGDFNPYLCSGTLCTILNPTGKDEIQLKYDRFNASSAAFNNLVFISGRSHRSHKAKAHLTYVTPSTTLI